MVNDMSSREIRILVTLIFLALIPFVALGVPPSFEETSPVEPRIIPIPGITIYEEDFTTTTDMDAGNTTAVGWGTGAINNARSYGVSFLDFWSTPYPVYSIDVQGRKAYAVLHNRTSAVDTQYVFNISDPSNISELSKRTSASWFYTSEIAGDIMFTGKSSPSWVGLFNVSTPYQISFPVDQYTFTAGTVTDLVTQGHFLYVAITGGVLGEGLSIIDFEDPSNILVTDGYGAAYRGLDVLGQLAYMANGTEGFSILNVSNPYAISPLGTLDTPGNATDVLVEGTRAYVADGSSGIRIIDVTNPAAPSLLGSVNTPGKAQRLALQGYSLFVADGSGGVRVIDVSDPTNPTGVTSIPFSYVYDLTLFDGVLVIGAESGIYTYEVGSITNLQQVSTYTTYDALDVDVQADTAFVAAGADGLVVLDVSDAASPSLITQYKHSSTVNYVSIDVQGQYCYVLDSSNNAGNRGLWAVDVSNPSSPVFRSRRDFADAFDLFVDGDVAYVANGTGGLALINVSNSFDINVDLDWVFDGSNYTAVHVQGHYVYAVASGASDGLFVYEATDLSDIILTSSLSIDSPLDVIVSGDFCLVASDTGGILLLNNTDPWNTPTILDSNSSMSAQGVDFFGNNLLAAMGYSGVFLFDTAVPTSIVESSSYQPLSTDCLRLKIAGDYVYVTCRDSLRVFRFFLSAGNTYETTSIAQSLDLDTSGFIIGNTTLNFNATQPDTTSITWFLSADGGSHWESVTPGIPHSFSFKGNDLRWRAQMVNSFGDRTATIFSLNLSYNTLPTSPQLDPVLDSDKDGRFNVTWGSSTDDTGVVSYHLQMSVSIDFARILDSWVLTRKWQNITMNSWGTRYFRVRAKDNNGEYSLWSTAEVINIVIIPPYPPPVGIPGFPLEGILVGLGLAVGFGLVRRRRRRT
jgi:hypothetical protein